MFRHTAVIQKILRGYRGPSRLTFDLPLSCFNASATRWWSNVWNSLSSRPSFLFRVFEANT